MKKVVPGVLITLLAMFLLGIVLTVLVRASHSMFQILIHLHASFYLILYFLFYFIFELLE